MAKLLEHEIDGIQEYDNPPPGWLMATLYASVVFGLWYGVVYPSFWFWPGTSGWSSSGQYTAQMQQAEKDYAHVRAAEASATLQPDDAAVVALGEKIFGVRCQACHGSKGEGRVGPSFQDDVWLYGGTDEDILTSVRGGRPKGMPPWGKQLKADEIVAVASFVRKLNNGALGKP